MAFPHINSVSNLEPLDEDTIFIELLQMQGIGDCTESSWTLNVQILSYFQ